VDGAILAAAGPALMAYTDEHFPGGCPTGSAVVSPAFELEAVGVEHVIHTVGPVWAGSEDVKLGDQADDVLLASCYSRSLDAAREIGAKGVAFPGISTGVYGFPKVRAAKIAVAHVVGDLARHEQPGGVVFCCFSEADAGVYREVIETFVQWTTGRRRCG
jgi:O-acetyl-ADP-ribose deacetylase (regulator of RNase III)